MTSGLPTMCSRQQLCLEPPLRGASNGAASELPFVARSNEVFNLLTNTGRSDLCIGFRNFVTQALRFRDQVFEV